MQPRNGDFRRDGMLCAHRQHQVAKRFPNKKFDAIFLDVSMPRPDGIELTRTIRTGALNRTKPIVIITGKDDRGVPARAFEAGASFFLFKPIDRQRILGLIRVTESSIQGKQATRQRAAECGRAA